MPLLRRYKIPDIRVKNLKSYFLNPKSVHKRTWIALGLLLLVLPIALVALLRPQSGEAAWWDDNWGYRKQVPLSNASGSTQEDFQVQITLDTELLIDNGKMQSSCYDLRITNYGGSILPFWIEPNTCNTTETKIWVKADVPSTGTSLYLYYGNPSTGSGSTTPSDVFIKEMDSAVVAWPLDETTATQSYSRAIHPADSEGRNIVINGTFDSDTSWTKGTGWTIADGVAHGETEVGVSTILVQSSGSLVGGKQYEFSFTISNYVSGSVRPQLGPANVGSYVSGNGTYTQTITAPSSGSYIGIWASNSSTAFVGDIDNVIVKQVNIPSSGDFTGTELLTDGDMEAADTSAWTALNNAILSKESTDPHGGSQLLRITKGVSGNPGARQSNILEVGKTYKISGWVKSDGNVTPQFMQGNGTFIIGGTTSTSWQYLEQIFIATSTNIQLYTENSTGSQYAEFDDVSVTEVSPLVGKNTNGVVPNADSNGHLSKAYTFDGTNDVVNIYSSDLNSAFNPDEGTIVAWAKVSDAGVWSDGSNRYILNIGSDVSNSISIRKYLNTNILRANYTAGGNSIVIDATSVSHTDYFKVALVWSKSSNQLKFYVNGSIIFTQTNIGNWNGNLASTTAAIGAINSSGSSPWSGLINDVRLYNRALSAEEISAQYNASYDTQNYYTENYPGKELIRKYDTDITIGTLGTEEVKDGPVMHLAFNEGYGSITNDQTSNNNDGTINGATWQTEDMCVSGKCLYFDGTDDYVDVGINSYDLGIRRSATYSAWVRPISGSDTSGIISDYSSSQGMNLRWETGGQLTFYVYPGDHRITVSNIASINEWHHVVGVMDEDNMYLYLDGKQIGSTTLGNDVGDSSSTLKIGTRGNRTTYNQGFIDDVKIYPYARTAEQIQADYNSGAASLSGANQSWLSDGLVGYWKMDEASWNGTSGEVKDASGNGNHGTAGFGGTSTGSNTASTLNDTNAIWASQALNGLTVTITSGTGNGQTRTISSNTKTSITVSTNWDTIPDNTSVYKFGNIPSVSSGKFGNGSTFGGNSAITFSSTSQPATWNANGRTISTWIKPSSDDLSGAHAALYGAASAGLQYPRLRINTINGKVRFSINIYPGPTTVTLIQTSSLTADNWYHAVVTWDEENYYLYINGSLESQATNPGITTDDLTVTAIGAELGNSPTYFNGSIDETRIYNRALSPSEVEALYRFAPGPVGYWNFDEGSGTTAYDRSGNGFNGTFKDNPNWTTGRYGKALDFDGENDGVATSLPVNELDNTKTYSFSAWVYPRSTSASYQHVITTDNGEWDWAIGHLNGEWGVNAGPSLGYENSGASVDLNTWQYVSAIFDGPRNKIVFYKNGVYVGEYGISYQSSSSNIHVGIKANNNFDFDGIIDDVRIYNYARTQEQILQDMLGKATPSTGSGQVLPDPIAHYAFDEQNGQTAHNSSKYPVASSLDGTLGATSSASTDDPTWETDCKVGGCLSFDGSNDYVNAGVSLPLNITGKISVSAWVYPTTNVGEHFVLEKRFLTAGDTPYWMSVNDGKLGFGFYDGSWRSKFSSINLNTNQWSHVAAVADGTKLDLYINGTRESYSFPYTANPSAIALLSIGKTLTNDRFWLGKIDEVKIYNVALTPDQVKQDMNAGGSINFGSTGVEEASYISDGAGDPPVAYWNFDEKSGTTLGDKSGNGNDGTISGATWTRGKVGGGLSFDGSGDAVSIETGTGSKLIINNSSVTLSSWIKPTSYPSSQAGIAGRQRGSVYGYGLALDSSGKFTVKLRNPVDGAPTYNSDTVIDLNEWTHVSASINDNGSSTTISFYVNGQLVKTTTGAIRIGSQNDTEAFLIGRQSSGSDFDFDGLIDDVKIYDYARTPAQIAYDYNRGEPIAHWRFDECQDTTAYDASGNGNNGTITSGSTGSNTSVGTCNGSSGSMWADGASGKLGASLEFDGTNDYVDLGSSSSLVNSMMSFSFWVKPNSLPPTGGTIKELLRREDSFHAAFDSGVGNALDIGIRDPGYRLIRVPFSYFPIGTWTHVTLTADGSHVRVYVNGKQYPTTPTYSGNIGVTPGNKTFVGAYGTSGNPTGRYFDGQIDDVRIYNYALSREQILRVMNDSANIRFAE